MSRWVFKSNRFDWAASLGGASSMQYTGRAEGRGGETLSSLSPGNVALAYQVEDRSFHGIVRVLNVQSVSRPAYLTLVRVHRFARPVRLADLVAKFSLLADVEAFTTGSASDTIRRLRPDEFRMIVEGCGVDAALREQLKI
jgi:hypothetical protein